MLKDEVIIGCSLQLVLQVPMPSLLEGILPVAIYSTESIRYTLNQQTFNYILLKIFCVFNFCGSRVPQNFFKFPYLQYALFTVLLPFLYVLSYSGLITAIV